MNGQKRAYTEVNVEKITPYVEHPIPIKITTEKEVAEAAMMHLTPKDRGLRCGAFLVVRVHRPCASGAYRRRRAVGGSHRGLRSGSSQEIGEGKWAQAYFGR